MVWIQGLDGELINMAHCRLVTIDPWTTGKANGDRFGVHLWLTDPEGAKFGLRVFQGTAAECGRYRDDLRNRMEKASIHVALDSFAAQLHDLFADLAHNLSRG
jgi:hypothetical protein